MAHCPIGENYRKCYSAPHGGLYRVIRGFDAVHAEIDRLCVECDGDGWRAKAFLYCLEARCPQSGWMVPLLPSLIVSRGKHVIADLIPDHRRTRYDIAIRKNVSEVEQRNAAKGTVRTDGRGQDPYLIHD